MLQLSFLFFFFHWFCNFPLNLLLRVSREGSLKKISHCLKECYCFRNPMDISLSTDKILLSLLAIIVWSANQFVASTKPIVYNVKSIVNYICFFFYRWSKHNQTRFNCLRLFLLVAMHSRYTFRHFDCFFFSLFHFKYLLLLFVAYGVWQSKSHSHSCYDGDRLCNCVFFFFLYIDQQRAHLVLCFMQFICRLSLPFIMFILI